jgi:hypothetical protein
VSELLERLRRETKWEPGRHIVPQLEERMDEAADEIVRLCERISTLEALTDQLAEALQGVFEPGCTYYDGHPLVSALGAYEADKEAHR